MVEKNKMKIRIIRAIGDKYEIQIVDTNKKEIVDKNEFHKSMEVLDDGTYTLKSGVEDIINKANDIATRALVVFMGVKSKDPPIELSNLSVLGGLSQEYCELMHCSPLQFVYHVKLLQSNFMETMINNGHGHFDEKVHNVPKHLRKQNLKNKKNIEEEDYDEKCSIGDILKAKQSN